MALALEEAGYGKHRGKSIFKKPPPKPDDVKRGSYIMITGQTRSGELIKDLSDCNAVDNKNGDEN